MKLVQLHEAIRRTSDDVKHDRESGRNMGPERLDIFLDAITNSKDVEEAKENSRKMAEFFALGGKEKFLKMLDKQRDMLGVVKLAYNTALKGEGLGVVGRSKKR